MLAVFGTALLYCFNYKNDGCKENHQKSDQMQMSHVSY